MVMKVGVVYRDALGAGGYPRDVRWLASALVSFGMDVTLYAKLETVKKEGLDERVRCEPMESVLRERVDLAHVFGLFIPQHTWLLRELLNQGRAVVVSPMGHFMPFALQRNRLKKWGYLRIVRPLLRRVPWWHVFSQEEAKSVERCVGSHVDCFQGSLGIFPIHAMWGRTSVTNTGREVKLLFFGRNDVYQKGIDILLAGFEKAIRNGASVRLTIAGAPWKNSESFMGLFVKKRGLQSNVELVGLVDEKRKWTLLRETDYLVFLSRWDGPPRPIREAIAVGTPVIVSPETNMGSLVKRYDAGMQVKLDPEEVARAVCVIGRDKALRRRFAEGVVKLRERLSWENVARDYVHGYQRIMGEREGHE
jgi:glycosyltransferase involved in cell wall biosynthesis